MSAARKATPTRAALAVFVVAGLAGAAWLWMETATRDAGAADAHMRRAAYIERARALSTRFGTETTNWRATAELDHEKSPENRVLMGQANSSSLEWPERYVRVVLIEPHGNRHISVRMTERGRLLRWRLEGRDEDDDVAGSAHSTPASLRELADAAVQAVAGDAKLSFHRNANTEPAASSTIDFEANDERLKAVRWQVHVEFRRGRLIRAELDPDILDRVFFSSFRWHLAAYDVRAFGYVCFIILAIYASIAGLQAMRRGSWDRTLALAAAMALALALVWTWSVGPQRDAWMETVATDDQSEAVFGLICGVLWTAWLWMAAEAQAQRGATPAWATLRMALAGREASLALWRAVAIGVAGGALLALLQTLPAWFWTHDATWRAMGTDALSRIPLSGALAVLSSAESVAVPLFVVSWLLRAKNLGLRSVFAGLVLTLLCLTQMHVEGSGVAVIVAALVSAPLLIALYWHGGALAFVAALVGARMWPAVCASRNDEAALTLAALCGGALLFAWKEGTPVAERWMPCDESHAPATRREQLQAEFGDARDAQRRLLPAAPPELDGYDIAAVCLPATDVGGDLYDFHTLSDGRTLLSVADVSGKGMPAALYMTLSKGVLAAVCGEHSDARLIATHANRTIHAASARTLGVSKVFVTAAFAALDPATGAVDVIRAGHNPPLLMRASGEASMLKPAGLAFGLASATLFDARIGVARVKLEPGDALVLYSDGITEAMNLAQDEFGEERLQQAAREPASAEALCTRVVEAVRAFAAGAPQHDDMTIVVVRRTR